MEKIFKHHRVLFLHGGPGLSTQIERLWFENALPIVWWDQPIKKEDQPFNLETIVEAATQKLNQLSEEAQGKVDIIAHSFAGQVAYALARESHHLIHQITMINCPYEPLSGIERLAAAMLTICSTDELNAHYQGFMESKTSENFKKLVFSIAEHPSFPTVYFGPNSKGHCDRFSRLMSSVRFLDIDTFFSVMENYVDHQSNLEKSPFEGQVKFLLGRHDPLVCLEKDVAKWRGIFPQMELDVLDAGHYMQFELCSKFWFV